MILGVSALLEFVHKFNLVEGLSERELSGGEGAGFDLRIGKLFKFPPGDTAFLGIVDRKTPDPLELISEYSEHDREGSNYAIIQPGTYYLMSTIEKVNLPRYLLGLVSPRTTLFRSGLLLLSAQVAPGYQGELTFGLANLGTASFSLEMGARVAHIMFFSIMGDTKPYEGTWQGGRVSTPEEKQK